MRQPPFRSTGNIRANSQRRGNAEPETPTDAEPGAFYVVLHLPRFLWVLFLVPGKLVPLVQDHFPLRKERAALDSPALHQVQRSAYIELDGQTGQADLAGSGGPRAYS